MMKKFIPKTIDRIETISLLTLIFCWVKNAAIYVILKSLISEQSVIHGFIILSLISSLSMMVIIFNFLKLYFNAHIRLEIEIEFQKQNLAMRKKMHGLNKSNEDVSRILLSVDEKIKYENLVDEKNILLEKFL